MSIPKITEFVKRVLRDPVFIGWASIAVAAISTFRGGPHL
jgi:hypothetical protein